MLVSSLGWTGEGKPYWITGAFTPVIWDDNYKLGLGLAAGGRTQFANHWEFGGEFFDTHFRPRLDGFKAVNEIGARALAVYPLPTHTPFTLKLGGYLGWNRLEGKHDYSSFGGVAEAAYDLNPPWGLFLQFSPGFLYGENSQAVFRLALGGSYAFGSAVKTRPAPKPKYVPPPPPPPKHSFEGTMVPLPENEPEEYLLRDTVRFNSRGELR